MLLEIPAIEQHFSSHQEQVLRETKSYTYDVRWGFNAYVTCGNFTISGKVRSSVTLESMQAIKEILDEYPKTFSQLDLKTTKGYLIKSNACGFETATAKLKFLENINRQGWKPDYVTEREAIVNSMTVHEIRKIAA
jgi:zinc protease